MTREEAIKYLIRPVATTTTPSEQHVKQQIAYIMAVEALKQEPVKRGKWEPHPSEREWDICSHCHLGTKRREYGLNDDGTEWVTEQSYTHCPWCGAKMENEDGNENI